MVGFVGVHFPMAIIAIATVIHCEPLTMLGTLNPQCIYYCSIIPANQFYLFTNFSSALLAANKIDDGPQMQVYSIEQRKQQLIEPTQSVRIALRVLANARHNAQPCSTNKSSLLIRTRAYA